MSTTSKKQKRGNLKRSTPSTTAAVVHVAQPTTATEPGSSVAAPAAAQSSGKKRKRQDSDAELNMETSSASSSSLSSRASSAIRAVRDGVSSAVGKLLHRSPSPLPHATAKPPRQVRRKAFSVPHVDVTPTSMSSAVARADSAEPDIPDERVQVKPSSVHPTMQYTAYRDQVLSGDVFFSKIDAQTWVGEVFDPTTLERRHGIDKWVVVRGEAHIDGKTTYFCTRCSDYKVYNTCCHTLLLERDECPPFKPLAKADDTHLVAFHNDTTKSKGMQIVSFLWMSPDTMGVEIVTFRGEASNIGRWRCSKHPEPTYVLPNGALGECCEHVQQCHASDLVLELLWFREDAAEAAQPDPETADEHFARQLDNAAKRHQKQQWEERSVSYLPVGPPEWARLDTDTVDSFPTTWPPPPFVPLGEEARCQCGQAADQTAARRRQTATVFGLSRVAEIVIETAPCTACSPRSGMNRAGPDMRCYGLFNFDNKRIFAHELLNDYTQSIISFTTPFSAYAKVVEYRYRNAHCNTSFVNDHLWVTAWFSFSKIQHLRDTFFCILCGPNPRVIILDGQTGGFKKQHMLPTLCPPTVLQPGRSVRVNVVPSKERTSAIKHKIRLVAQRIVRWRKALTETGESSLKGISANDTIADAADADADEMSAKRQAEKRKAERNKNDVEMRSRVDEVVKTLEAEGLKMVARMFKEVIQPKYEKEKETRRQTYLNLLNEIFAHESILMFVPQPTWPTLRLLEKGDKTACMALLREVPALGAVAMLEMNTKAGISPELKSLAKWLADRASDVWVKLPRHQPDAPDAKHDPGDRASIEAGIFYGRQRVRLRPEYPNLPHDRAADRATLADEAQSGGIGCSKFYEWYGLHGLTGGIMGCWCPHLISLGYHLIPKGEGRNDVFSTLYCYWEEAPWCVVYDFACALGPYCLAREPEFFKNTRFVIDGFHAKGHTRCSPACFLSTYRATNGNLDDVNSSAAECGNAGLARIRKALSYMTQEHAMILILVFLAMWNRARRLEDPRLQQTSCPPIPTDPRDLGKMDFSRAAAGSSILGWLPEEVVQPLLPLIDEERVI